MGNFEKMVKGNIRGLLRKWCNRSCKFGYHKRLKTIGNSGNRLMGKIFVTYVRKFHRKYENMIPENIRIYQNGR